MADAPQYPLEYFLDLGFTAEEAARFVVNWNRQEPQTEAEIRAGLEWERAAREELAARHFEANPQAKK